MYNLSKLLSKSLQKTVGHTEYYIRDSFDLKKKISDIFIPNNYTIISLHAVSMYTNILWNLIRKSVKQRWNQIKLHSFLKHTHFDNILQFCLESSYCTFNNEYYKQIFGLPIGSHFSVIAANVVMEEIEMKILMKLPHNIIFYYRYVDDTLIYLPKNKVEDILYRFSFIDKKLKFTLETSINNNSNFLDLNIQIIIY